MSNPEKINEGRTSEILAMQDGRVIKLFRERYEGNAEHEAHAARMAFSAGISVPEIFGMTKMAIELESSWNE